MICHQHEDSHTLTKPLEFTDNQSRFRAVAIEIDHHQIHRRVLEAQHPIMPAPGTLHLPAVFLQQSTAEIQIDRIIPDAKKGTTLSSSHRLPLSTGFPPSTPVDDF